MTETFACFSLHTPCFAPYALKGRSSSPGICPGLLRALVCCPVRAKALKLQTRHKAFALTGRLLYPGRCPGNPTTSLHFLSRRTMILSAISKKTILALAFCEIMRLLSSKRLEMSMMFASLMKRAKFLAKFSSSCVM